MAKKRNDSMRYAKRFYGATRVGDKGQVVIPVSARREMGVAAGEELLVFGIGGDMLALVKLARVERIAEHLAGQLKMIDAAITAARKKK